MSEWRNDIDCLVEFFQERSGGASFLRRLPHCGEGVSGIVMWILLAIDVIFPNQTKRITLGRNDGIAEGYVLNAGRRFIGALSVALRRVAWNRFYANRINAIRFESIVVVLLDSAASCAPATGRSSAIAASQGRPARRTPGNSRTSRSLQPRIRSPPRRACEAPRQGS